MKQNNIKREELLKVIAEEFVSLFQQEWVRQLPSSSCNRDDLLNGFGKAEGFAEAMLQFFSGMCYRAQDEALKKLLIKFKAMRDL